MGRRRRRCRCRCRCRRWCITNGLSTCAESKTCCSLQFVLLALLALLEYQDHQVFLFDLAHPENLDLLVFQVLRVALEVQVVQNHLVIQVDLEVLGDPVVLEDLVVLDLREDLEVQELQVHQELLDHNHLVQNVQ